MGWGGKWLLALASTARKVFFSLYLKVQKLNKKKYNIKYIYFKWIQSKYKLRNGIKINIEE
jgi:hypothetical protein